MEEGKNNGWRKAQNNVTPGGALKHAAGVVLGFGVRSIVGLSTALDGTTHLRRADS